MNRIATASGRVANRHSELSYGSLYPGAKRTYRKLFNKSQRRYNAAVIEEELQAHEEYLCAIEEERNLAEAKRNYDKAREAVAAFHATRKMIDELPPEVAQYVVSFSEYGYRDVVALTEFEHPRQSMY